MATKSKSKAKSKAKAKAKVKAAKTSAKKAARKSPAKSTAKAAKKPSAVSFISSAALLDHWQGHRRLTRRVIEAFPDQELFKFSIGGMRTFGELANELLGMSAPMASGLVALNWNAYAPKKATSKAELLRLWDESTKQINDVWSKIPSTRWAEPITSFGQYTGPGHWQMLYIIDNEIHHRGQGYVYLRALKIQPPAFYER